MKLYEIVHIISLFYIVRDRIKILTIQNLSLHFISELVDKLFIII